MVKIETVDDIKQRLADKNIKEVARRSHVSASVLYRISQGRYKSRLSHGVVDKLSRYFATN